jgi:hypothetical protein
MTPALVSLILAVAGVYLLLGALFAVLFVARLAVASDCNLEGAGLRVRLLLAPGAVLLWPIVIIAVRRKPTTMHEGVTP